MRFELMLLAGARVKPPDGKVFALERKTAALLALVALEESASRARAASLLWPEVPDRTARANLRQVLRRLRVAAGADLLEGRDPMRLGAAVQVDALGRTATGELLAGYEYDDCPELAEWLSVQRELCRSNQCVSLLDAADRLELQGELRAALEVARRLTNVHPQSEHGHQRVIRLFHKLGDRPAAIHAFEVAERTLRRLCDSPPSPQTRALLRDIRSEAPERGSSQYPLEPA